MLIFRLLFHAHDRPNRASRPASGAEDVLYGRLGQADRMLDAPCFIRPRARRIWSTERADMPLSAKAGAHRACCRRSRFSIAIRQHQHQPFASRSRLSLSAHNATAHTGRVATPARLAIIPSVLLSARLACCLLFALIYTRRWRAAAHATHRLADALLFDDGDTISTFYQHSRRVDAEIFWPSARCHYADFRLLAHYMPGHQTRRRQILRNADTRVVFRGMSRLRRRPCARSAGR